MSAWVYAALLAIPLAAAALRCVRPWFALNAIVSLSCAAIVLAARGAVSPLFFGLIVSVAADWFMAHKAGRTGWYLCGIGGFFAAHALFLWDVLLGASLAPLPFLAFALLAAGYGLYLARRILPRVSDARMRLAIVLYMLISAASLGFSLAAPGAARTLGLLCIVLSDTLIAENDFAGNRAAGAWILPTYFLCHILLALSAVVEKGM